MIQKAISDIKIAVAIPWRTTPSRVPLLSKVVGWYEDNLPEAEIFYADSDHETFNASAARNMGVKMASSYDIIINNDADVIPTLTSLKLGILKVLENNLLCNPYEEVRELTEAGTRSYLDGDILLDDAEHNKIIGSCGGIIIATPSSWNAVGGADESFIGWGYEDAALAVAHRSIMGQDFLSVSGVAYSMYHHPAEKNVDKLIRNRNILQEYFDAEKDVLKMKELIDSRKNK